MESPFGRACLEAILDRFPGRRVAVLGDLVLDEFVLGDIARVSREAPVLILEHRQTLAVPGGGGNAARNLRALGAIPLVVGVVGQDEPGQRLLEVFREEGISSAGVLRARAYATPCKSRIVAGGAHTRRQQIVRLDRGQRPGALPPQWRERLAASLARALGRAEGLLVADYGYGAATPELVRPWSNRASRVVTVDSRARVAAFRRVTACTPNQEELERAVDAHEPVESDAALARAARSLLRRCGARCVLVTRGPRGVSLLQPRKPPLHVPAFGTGEVADVTGAGDTVTATFTLALVAGASPEQAALLANCAAGLVVMKAGTATVSLDELRRAVREVGT